MEQFSKKACEQLKAYVYKLIDPRNGQVFYIGKGRNNRIFDHVNDTDKYLKEKQEELTKQESKNSEIQIDEISEKINTIKEIKNEGLEVTYVIHRHGLTDEEAYLVEAALIDDTPGLTNIQIGHGNGIGPKSIKQINDLYNLETIEKFDNEDKILLIKIKPNNSESIKEQGRKWWILSQQRQKKIKTAVISVDNEVKLVLKVNENSWKEMPGYSDNYKGKKRYGFDGTEDKKLNEKYLHKTIPEQYRKRGMANPILYTF